MFAPGPPRRLPLTLIGFGFLSLAAHGLAFLLFRVVYPPAVGLVPPTPYVTVLMPGLPEHEALLRWVAAEDPALVATSLAAQPPLQLVQEYRPSYATLRTPPRSYPVEEESTASTLPGLMPPLAPHRPAESAALAVRRSPAVTALTLGGPLSTRGLVSEPAWPRGITTPLQPSSYLVGADGQGVIRYVLLTQGSGQAEVDAQAGEVIRATILTRSPEPIAWGWLSVHWGDDVYAGATHP